MIAESPPQGASHIPTQNRNPICFHSQTDYDLGSSSRELGRTPRRAVRLFNVRDGTMKCRIARHWLTGTGYTWIVLLMFASCGTPGTEGDYLSPELRARVEQLKKEAATSPTTAENLQARTDVFWDWANAYTLTGGPIPANLPVWVVSIRMAATDGWEAPAPWLLIVDHYIEELTLKDEHPEGLGELKVASEAPLVAAQWATVEQTYTIGSRPMKPGGGFMVAKQSSQGPDPFQNEDPAADWYVTIRSSNPGAQFQRFTRSLDGMHGGRSKTETPTFIIIKVCDLVLSAIVNCL